MAPQTLAPTQTATLVPAGKMAQARFSGETNEQRKLRLAKDAERKRQRRAAETEEEYKTRLLKVISYILGTLLVIITINYIMWLGRRVCPQKKKSATDQPSYRDHTAGRCHSRYSTGN